MNRQRVKTTFKKYCTKSINANKISFNIGIDNYDMLSRQLIQCYTVSKLFWIFKENELISYWSLSNMSDVKKKLT
jgi:hypothetical protein